MFGGRARSLPQLLEKCEAAAVSSGQGGCVLALHTFGLHPMEFALLDEAFFRLVAARESERLDARPFPLAVFMTHHPPFFLGGGLGLSSCFLFGLSGRPRDHVHPTALRGLEEFLRGGAADAAQKLAAPHLPLIRRFTGGGTVLLDEQNAICTALVLPPRLLGAPVLPRRLMVEAFRFFAGGLSEQPLLQTPASSGSSAALSASQLKGGRLSASPFSSGFSLVENDFCVAGGAGETPSGKAAAFRKVAGNAQSVSQGAALQHTSFLWFAPDERMEQVLLSPTRQPAYRAQRRHSAFCAKVSEALKTSVEAASGAPLRLEGAAEFAASLHLLVEQSAQDCRSVFGKGGGEWGVLSAVLASPSARPPLTFFRRLRRLRRKRDNHPQQSAAPAPLAFTAVEAQVARELVARLQEGSASAKSLRGTFFLDPDGRRLPDEVYRQLLAVNGIVPLPPQLD